MVNIFHSLFFPSFFTHFIMSSKLKSAISDAVTKAEVENRAEIRVVIEASLSLFKVIMGTTIRQRAEELFLQNGMHHTMGKTGILIYIYLADTKVEIVTDVGIPRDELGLTDLIKNASSKVAHLKTSKYKNLTFRLQKFVENLLFNLGEALRGSSLKLAPGENDLNEISD